MQKLSTLSRKIMPETAQQLKDRLRQSVAQGDSGGAAPAQTQDRFIKGTLIDDKLIAVAQKIATIVLIVALLGAGWLWLERTVGVDTLRPYRVWTPSVFMAVMMFITKPFLRLGWFGWAFVLVQSVNLSGYFFQVIQKITGIR